MAFAARDVIRSAGLPIEAVIPELTAALAIATRVVLQAPPGAGKSTVVPLAMLDCDWLKGGRIIMLEPRRLAARAVAARMALTLREEVGRTVGHRMRMDTRVSRETRIEVVTEGALTRPCSSNASRRRSRSRALARVAAGGGSSQIRLAASFAPQAASSSARPARSVCRISGVENGASERCAPSLHAR